MSLIFNNKRIGFNGKRLVASKVNEVIIGDEPDDPDLPGPGDEPDGPDFPGPGDDPGGMEMG